MSRARKGSALRAGDAEELRRLHFINALFAHVTGRDLYLANQIKEAIRFSLAELERQETENPELAARRDRAFNAAAAKLMAECFKSLPGHGFFHWDAARTTSSATPLFTRAELMEGFRQLATHRESTLLITNLRPALVPAGKRRSQRRERDYAEALDFIRELAAARTPRHSSLRLLFL